MPIERKLAAIMFTDIAGYTEQMSKDEAVAISLLNKKESVLKPLIKEHNGTYVKSTGDGSLSHFNSAVDAARCAKRLQESIYDDKDLNVRIGVHLGDTIFEKGDIHGDGVNIASRLESMAVEGGVFVSKEVHDQLVNQKGFEGISLGLQSMKGVGRLIEVFGLKGSMIAEPDRSKYQDNKISVHSNDEVPTVAIIPLKNKGQDKDAFYAYGISAELISDCSSAGLIRVASLKDIENLDYKTLDTSEIASKLFVRYIASGTLWKMDEIFQLSIELYDTIESKVLWSDIWEESWENLPTIKGNLADGLLKTLDTNTIIEKKVGTSNTEAYEYYLRAKYIYEKRENMNDTEVARGLLKKSIGLDNNMLEAKNLYGVSHFEVGNYNEAMKIYMDNLKQAEQMDEKRGIGHSLRNIGAIHTITGDLDTSLYYFNRSLKIFEEISDQDGLAKTYNGFGIAYNRKGCYDKAIYYYICSLEISKNIGSKRGIGTLLGNIAGIYGATGDFEKSLDYANRSLKLLEEACDKRMIGYILGGMGIFYYNNSEYKKASEYLDESRNIHKKIGIKTIELENTLYTFLSYKHLGKEYDRNEIYNILKEKDNFEFFDTPYALYKLLQDCTYLETAYNQIQEKADNLKPDDATKFLSYPIPAAIVEEWKKMTTNKN